MTYKDTKEYMKQKRGFPVFMRDSRTLNNIVSSDIISDKDKIEASVKGNGPGIAYSAGLNLLKMINKLLVGNERNSMTVKHGADCIESLNNDPKEEKVCFNVVITTFLFAYFVA